MKRHKLDKSIHKPAKNKIIPLSSTIRCKRIVLTWDNIKKYFNSKKIIQLIIILTFHFDK
jgi:hypothetical protein